MTPPLFREKHFFTPAFGFCVVHAPTKCGFDSRRRTLTAVNDRSAYRAPVAAAIQRFCPSGFQSAASLLHPSTAARCLCKKYSSAARFPKRTRHKGKPQYRRGSDTPSGWSRIRRSNCKCNYHQKSALSTPFDFQRKILIIPKNP